MLQIVIERSFDWTLAITAGVGLVGAVIGSVATLAGQWLRDARELRRHRVGTIKAVLHELRMNAALVIARIGFGGKISQVSTIAWQRSNHDLAQFLPDATYLLLATSYAQLPVADEMTEVDTLKKVLKSNPTMLRSWFDDIVEVQERLLRSDYAIAFRAEWADLSNLREAFDEEMREREEQDHDETR